MTDAKSPAQDEAEQVIQDALAAVEKIEKDSQLSADDVEVLAPSELPPSGDLSDEGEVIADDTPTDPMLMAMITAKNELQHVLEQTQKEAKSMQERLTRTQADFENYKKRQMREREEAIKFANERVLKDLMPVLDNMDRAVDAAKAQSLSEEGKTVVEGISLVLKQFTDTMGRYGVVGFSALGEPFDPNLHEAVAQREDKDVPAGTVTEEYQRGYKLHDRLVRPAMVIVSTGGPKREKAAKEDEE